jgi:ElaB/YqjD/DUF883 family membrane-anchored ribosome-binding protein
MSTHTAHHSGSHNSDHKLTSVREEIAELKDTMQASAQDAVQHSRRLARATTVAAKDAAVGLRDSALQARDQFSQTIAERPFTSVLIAAAAGAGIMGLAMMWRRKP